MEGMLWWGKEVAISHKFILYSSRIWGNKEALNYQKRWLVVYTTFKYQTSLMSRLLDINEIGTAKFLFSNQDFTIYYFVSCY